MCPRFISPQLLILGFDHNKDHLELWADSMLGNASAGSAPFVAGMAFHWYNGVDDRTLDGTSGYSAVRATRERFPDAILLATEGCSCPGVWLGNWFRGERLAHDLMFDVNNWAQGWIDWNLLVDINGGPNHLGNMCDAPLVANPDFTDIIIQPKYYFMGHFSKYVPPRSRRVRSSVAGNFSNALDDPNMQGGVELGVFACEHSSRQLWALPGGQGQGRGAIRLAVPALADTQHAAPAISLCVIPAASSAYLRVGDCAYSGRGATPIMFHSQQVSVSDLSSSVHKFAGDSSVFQLAYTVDSTQQCLVVDAGTYNGALGGAMLRATPCLPADRAQLWMRADIPDGSGGQLLGSNLISVGDSMQAGAGAASCLTAGWPFLTASAFDTGDSTVVVVMNESPSHTRYAVVSDAAAAPLLLGISARAIQTIVF
jgi:hypothetical protein